MYHRHQLNLLSKKATFFFFLLLLSYVFVGRNTTYSYTENLTSFFFFSFLSL